MLDSAYAPTVPRPPRLLAREVGPATVVLLAVAYGVLWLFARPSSVSAGSYFGQWCGAESILLLSIALVLISSLPWVEVWFDGIDRAAIWHRRVAMLGLLLLLPHILLSTGQRGQHVPGQAGHGGGGGGQGATLGVIGLLGLLALVIWAILPRWRAVVPRALRPLITTARDLPGIRHFRRIVGGYERWRLLHRTTGLFVALGFIHGIMDGTPFNAAADPALDLHRDRRHRARVLRLPRTDRPVLPVPARLPGRRGPRGRPRPGRGVPETAWDGRCNSCPGSSR